MRGSMQIKRAYDAASDDDGVRVLVDRLWPRGVSKSDAHIDHWLKDIAPSAELRQWFGHRPERWAEFRQRYRSELAANPEVDRLREIMSAGQVTLVYGAKDRDHNDAVVLAEFLQDRG
ncbi:MAG TPA: DUF488 domain-containing protein [Caulobacteraceae bacterium]|jgi:uncharacterized protein YeaO (DUF488 family)|nr:DUF488 domain-containing protein [Caulobacteraceae bacterium]